MAKLGWKAALAAAVLLLAGCGGPEMLRSDTHPDKEALVFGYIDMDEAPSGMDWMAIRQALPKTDKPILYAAVSDGLFYNSRLAPGSYEIDSFGGHPFLGNTDYTYQLPRQDLELGRFKFRKPGVYFLGSFKYKKISHGWFQQDEFDIVPADKPTATELLQRMLKEAKSDEWKARIKVAIEELHGK